MFGFLATETNMKVLLHISNYTARNRKDYVQGRSPMAEPFFWFLHILLCRSLQAFRFAEHANGPLDRRLVLVQLRRAPFFEEPMWVNCVWTVKPRVSLACFWNELHLGPKGSNPYTIWVIEEPQKAKQHQRLILLWCFHSFEALQFGWWRACFLSTPRRTTMFIIY